MGMKPKNQLPPVPELPKTTVNPRPDKTQEAPVKPAKRQAADTSEVMTKADWKAKDVGISVDAIHKSSLEGNTLANLTVGHSESEVLGITERFVRAQVALNQKIKGE